ncbi:hypothetical protein P7C70_g8196, partial [Phenoliferia sp. Uapishka_3]
MSQWGHPRAGGCDVPYRKTSARPLRALPATTPFHEPVGRLVDNIYLLIQVIPMSRSLPLPSGTYTLLPLIEACDNFELPPGPWDANSLQFRWKLHQSSRHYAPPPTHNESALDSDDEDEQASNRMDSSEFLAPFFITIPNSPGCPVGPTSLSRRPSSNRQPSLRPSSPTYSPAPTPVPASAPPTLAPQPIGFLRPCILRALIEDNTKMASMSCQPVWKFLPPIATPPPPPSPSTRSRRTSSVSGGRRPSMGLSSLGDNSGSSRRGSGGGGSVGMSMTPMGSETNGLTGQKAGSQLAEALQVLKVNGKEVSGEMTWAAGFEDWVVEEGSETMREHIDRVCRAWKMKGMFPDPLMGWRNEEYAIYGPHTPFDKNAEPKLPGGNFAFSMERAACGLFGFATYGVHCTAYVEETDEPLKIWVPRRSATKQTWPSYLDNTVAGGITSLASPLSSIIRECAEEASLPESLTEPLLRSVSVLSYTYRTPAGWLQPEVQYIYDLKLPSDVEPQTNVDDGEVESFSLMEVEEVVDRMCKGEFKSELIFDFPLSTNGLSLDTINSTLRIPINPASSSSSGTAPGLALPANVPLPSAFEAHAQTASPTLHRQNGAVGELGDHTPSPSPDVSHDSANTSYKMDIELSQQLPEGSKVDSEKDSKPQRSPRSVPPKLSLGSRNSLSSGGREASSSLSTTSSDGDRVEKHDAASGDEGSELDEEPLAASTRTHASERRSGPDELQPSKFAKSKVTSPDKTTTPRIDFSAKKRDRVSESMSPGSSLTGATDSDEPDAQSKSAPALKPDNRGEGSSSDSEESDTPDATSFPTTKPTSSSVRGRGRPRGGKRGSVKPRSTASSHTSETKKKPRGAGSTAAFKGRAAPGSPYEAGSPGVRATRATVTLPPGYIEGVKSARMTRVRSASSTPAPRATPQPTPSATAESEDRLSPTPQAEDEPDPEPLLSLPPLPPLQPQAVKGRKGFKGKEKEVVKEEASEADLVTLVTLVKMEEDTSMVVEPEVTKVVSRSGTPVKEKGTPSKDKGKERAFTYEPERTMCEPIFFCLLQQLYRMLMGQVAAKRRKVDAEALARSAERAAAKAVLLEQLEEEAEKIRDSTHPLIELTYEQLASEKTLRLSQLARSLERQERVYDKILYADSQSAWRQWADAKDDLRTGMYFDNQEQLKQLIYEEQAYPFLRDHPLLVNTHNLPPVPYYRGPLSPDAALIYPPRTEFYTGYP